nr:MAG TPA: PetN [Caudoviricetes sp.]
MSVRIRVTWGRNGGYNTCDALASAPRGPLFLLLM